MHTVEIRVESVFICISAPYLLLSCSHSQQILAPVWGNRLNFWPPGLPHFHLAEDLCLSSQPSHTVQHVCTPEAGMG